LKARGCQGKQTPSFPTSTRSSSSGATSYPRQQFIFTAVCKNDINPSDPSPPPPPLHRYCLTSHIPLLHRTQQQKLHSKSSSASHRLVVLELPLLHQTQHQQHQRIHSKYESSSTPHLTVSLSWGYPSFTGYSTSSSTVSNSTAATSLPPSPAGLVVSKLPLLYRTQQHQ
jgi:hypothetical protein